MTLRKLLSYSLIYSPIEITVYADSNWAKNINAECKYYHIKNGLRYSVELLKVIDSEEYRKIMESKVEFFDVSVNGTFEIVTYTF